jgi:hypothetical protein
VRAWVTESRGREGNKRKEREGSCVGHEREREKERKEEKGGGGERERERDQAQREKRGEKVKDKIRWDTWHNVSGWEKMRISSLANQMMPHGREILSFI